jgi:hypothetical protein
MQAGVDACVRLPIAETRTRGEALPVLIKSGACAADVVINAPAAASAQVSRRMIVDRILDFQYWRIGAYMSLSVSSTCAGMRACSRCRLPRVTAMDWRDVITL